LLPIAQSASGDYHGHARVVAPIESAPRLAGRTSPQWIGLAGDLVIDSIGLSLPLAAIYRTTRLAHG
jgi:hypothetical protein